MNGLLLLLCLAIPAWILLCFMLRILLDLEKWKSVGKRGEWVCGQEGEEDEKKTEDEEKNKTEDSEMKEKEF